MCGSLFVYIYRAVRLTMSGGVVFWPWAECVVALFIYLSAIITKAKMTRIGGVELGCTPNIIPVKLTVSIG